MWDAVLGTPRHRDGSHSHMLGAPRQGAQSKVLLWLPEPRGRKEAVWWNRQGVLVRPDLGVFSGEVTLSEEERGLEVSSSSGGGV